MKKYYLFIMLIYSCFGLNLGFAQHTKSPNLNDVLSLKIVGNAYQDNLYIAFNQNATAGYDGQYDVLKLYGIYAAPQFFSIVQDTLNLSINSVPFPLGNYTVQLGLMLGKDTSYTITATGADSFSNFPVVLLEDTKTSNFINLIQQPVYTFIGFTTDSVKRFKVHFSNSTFSNVLKDNDIQVYTFGKRIFINTTTSDNIKNIEITDLQGRKLQQFSSVNESKYIIDCILNSSVYIISIQTQKKRFSQKILIE